MNILDENIIASQRQLLRSWRIRVRQIGYDIAQKGISDEQIFAVILTVSLRLANRITTLHKGAAQSAIAILLAMRGSMKPSNNAIVMSMKRWAAANTAS